MRNGGGDHQLHAPTAGLQAVKRGKAAGGNGQGRAGPVEGQAIPRRKLDHFQFGREEMRRICHRAHRRIIGRDEHRASTFAIRRRRPRQIGQHQRLATPRKAGQSQRRGGGKDAGKIGHG